MKTIAFHNLGCKVNSYELDVMQQIMREKGYEIVPFDQKADIYVINTCTVTGTGDKKSLQAARRIRREHPGSALVLCGCLAQRMGEALLDTGAVLVLGTQRRAEIVQLTEQAVASGRPISAVDPLPEGTPYEPLRAAVQEGHTRAVMKIQEGCGNRCTYCIIPSVRGPIRSQPPAETALEARALGEAGFREIVLTGIHLTSYGRDLGDHVTLLDAIRAVHDVPGIERIRLGSLEPTIATREFAASLRALPKVCPQFHLALQSGSDTVLQRMARRYNMRMYREGAGNLRDVFPDAALTTDILTGFPGETEAEFLETCDAIRSIGFSRIHVFPYSRRDGTKAAVLPGQLSRQEKERRVRQLIAIGEETSRAYRNRWLGREAVVLLEEAREGTFIGYTPEYISVSVPACDGLESGMPVRVVLTGLTQDGMCGHPAR